MMIDRRTLLRGGILVAVPSAFSFLSLSSTGKTDTSRPLEAVPLQAVGLGPDPNQIVLKIDGWEIGDDAGSDAQVSIKIHQSWRAAWR